MKPILFLIVLLFVFSNNNHSQPTTGTLIDSRDGKIYKTVKIGNQWWMAENLAYLPTVSPGNVGSSSESHYYVYGFWGSDLNTAKSSTYYIDFGALYNWHAALESCPDGWHLPSDEEWTELSNFLGGDNIAGDKMKEVGYEGWSVNATNESGFTALPSGIRSELGGFGDGFIWIWSSSAVDASSAWYRSLYSEASLNKGSSNMASGFSIRCVKNNIQNQPPNKPILLTPANASAVSAPFSLTWSCSDPDGDQLSYVLYVRENGGNWESESLGLNTYYDIPHSDDPNDLTYDWYIVASDGTNTTQSDIWQFVILGSASYCTPTLISPNNGAVLDNGCSDRSDLITWTFDWQDCANATRYHLYVINSGAEIPVVNIDNIAGESFFIYQCDGCVTACQNWTWKVRAMINGVWGPWSEVRTFEAEPIDTDCQQNQHPPNKPILLTPVNGSYVSAPFSLTWTCSDPDGDQLSYVLFLRETGGNWESESLGSNAFYEIPNSNVTKDLTYDWYIVASDGTNTTQSDIWQFVILGSISDCAPNLISPNSGAVLDNGCNIKSDPILWNFDWQDCEGALKYNIYVYNTSMDVPYIDIDGLETSVCNYSQTIPIDNNNLNGWKWKVRSMVNNTWGPWSEERPFTLELVNTDCPQISECTPILVSPNEGNVLDNGCSDLSDLVTWNFDWQDCTGASKYHLYVKHTAAVNPVVDNQNITTSSYTFNNYGSISNNVSSQWIWKVRSMANGEWGPWSEERPFSVEKVNSDCSSLNKISAKITNFNINESTITKGSETIAATFTITNTGNVKSTFNPEVESVTGNSQWYSWSSSNDVMTLEPGVAGNVTFTWSPGPNVPTGNYSINATVLQSDIVIDNKIAENWFPNIFNITDETFKPKISNISLNNNQFAKNVERLESIITIKNESNKSGTFILKTTLRNLSNENTYTCNTQNISINSNEVKRINLQWTPDDQIISGFYIFAAILTELGTNNTLHTSTFYNTIKIFGFDANIKIENKINDLFSSKIIWTSENNNVSPVKICADGSTATIIKLTDNSNSYNLNNIRFKLPKDPNSTNSDKYGKFSKYEMNGRVLSVTYQHPDYVEENYTPFHPDTIFVFDVNQLDKILIKIPLQIFRAPLLLVHGLWGDADALIDLDTYLTNRNYYTFFNRSRAQYKSTNDRSFEVNKAVVPLAINSLFEKLRSCSFSAGKVDIVAHSMGGVLTRYYQQSTDYRKDIHKIITLNTPHSGTQSANMLLDKSVNGLSAETVRLLLKASHRNIENGAVYDLQVNSTEFDKLNNTNSLNRNVVPSHAISSYYLQPIIPNTGFWENSFDKWLVNIYGAENLNQLYNLELHDVIVPLSSQKGGLTDNVTLFNNATHLTVRMNQDVFPSIVNLLSQRSKDPRYFSQTGYTPKKLEYSSLKSTLKNAEQNCNDCDVVKNSIDIISPLVNELYLLGDDIPISVKSINGVNRLLINVSYPDFVYSLDTIVSSGTFTFNATNEIVDSLNILVIGYKGDCIVDYKDISVRISNGSNFDSLTYNPKSIIVSEKSTQEISFTGYYKGGLWKHINIDEIKDFRYEISDTAIFTIGKNNIVIGKLTGYAAMNIYYNDTSIIIPIHVIHEDTVITNYILNKDDYTSVDNLPIIGHDNLKLNDFIIFPNPSNGIFNIDINTNEHSILKVLSINGIELNKGKIPFNKGIYELNLSDFPKGMYYIMLINNNAIKTKKIIIL